MKQNRNTYRGVIILALDPDPESDCLHFDNSGSGFGSSKKWNRNNSSQKAFPNLYHVELEEFNQR